MRRIAEAIAIAAVRYFMVKFSRGKVIVFDIDEALSFEGESGPYLQYAVVRANNIFNKLKERAGLDEAACRRCARARLPPTLLTSDSDEAHDVWGLVLEAARLDEVVDQAVRTLELSVVAKYAFGLAQAFNALLPPLPDPQRGARRRPDLACGGGRLLPEPADPRARADGRAAMYPAQRCRPCRSEQSHSTIGVTRCSKLDDYVASVEQTGARARILEVTESPRKVLGEVDGVLLTGGGDVDPVFYGEDRHPLTDDAEPGRDEFEIDLARRAMTDDVPLLAICRGAQVLNVAAGGTLVQDIPSAVESDLTHSVKAAEEPRLPRHRDRRRHAGCRACSATGGRRLQLPRQQPASSVGRPDRQRPVVSARAADGVVEAIEKPDAAFCIGVQWHPENFWQSGEFRPLFEAFVDAARERLTRR